MPTLVYSPRYDIRFFGLERLHPFDSRKYGRAWSLLEHHFGQRLRAWHLAPARAASADELAAVHDAGYLARDLRSSRYLARALELPVAALAPARLIDRLVLAPMRWATKGTVLAAEAALRGRFAVNLAGGYHHASAARGEGFCIYADVGVAVAEARRSGRLAPARRLLYIDLDAHQGNGVARLFADDRAVAIFDQYNAQIYPQDGEARRRIDWDLALPMGTDDSAYLSALQHELPAFLDHFDSPQLAIYNAGTDVYQGDALGGLRLSARAVLSRDLFVAEQLTTRGIPWVMLLSGGYSRESYRLVAASVQAFFERWGESFSV